jgi:hypothetical protein
VGRQLSKCLFNLQQFVQHKLHIAQRRMVTGHAGLLKLGMIEEGRKLSKQIVVN